MQNKVNPTIFVITKQITYCWVMKQAAMPSRPGGEELGTNPLKGANHLVKVRILPQQRSGFH